MSSFGQLDGIKQGLAVFALTGAASPCHHSISRCFGLKGLELKREHGEDDPKGAKTVTAPATVSGEVWAMPLGNREGA